MRYYRKRTISGEQLIVQTDEEMYNLTAAQSGLTSFNDLAAAASISGRSINDLAAGLLDQSTHIDTADPSRTFETPLKPQEVWAAGVTYQISEQARERESEKPEIYLDVYESDRPELFFKATSDRLASPGGAVGIRGDSDWNVPEPELAIVLYHGDIVGYTIGNDVSSRSIEGQNPLYLPQAKVYDRSCSIGPCIVDADAIDPLDLDLEMTIRRNGKTVFCDSTTTSEMVRTPEELVDYLTRYNKIPESTVLLTGTSLVPDKEFTLRDGDEVEIEIEKIGVLQNSVTSM